MAEMIKYLDYEGLKKYDGLIKDYIKKGDDSIREFIGELPSDASEKETVIGYFEDLIAAANGDTAALEALLGDWSDLAEGKTVREYLDAADEALDSRVEAIETLIGAAGDSDDVINKLQEVIDWFKDVEETETGAQLLATVAKLNGDENTVGSLKKAVADLKGDLGDSDADTLAGLNDRIDALDAAAYEGVEDAEEGQYVSVSEVADNKQILTVTIGSFSSEATADSEKVEQVKGLATVEDVEEVIVANEKVTAAALNDLNDRLDVLEGDGEGSLAKAVAGLKGDVSEAGDTLGKLEDRLESLIDDDDIEALFTDSENE